MEADWPVIEKVLEEALGNLHTYDPHALPGTYPIGAGTGGLITFALILTLLRSFANGGSSLTGLEAISNGVSAFKPPAGVNARRTLSLMSLMLGFLVATIAPASPDPPRVAGTARRQER